jgi:hypothetical protein
MTDPDARLARKSDGQSSILAYAGHMLMENRSGLVAHVCLTRAGGTAERDAVGCWWTVWPGGGGSLWVLTRAAT